MKVNCFQGVVEGALDPGVSSVMHCPRHLRKLALLLCLCFVFCMIQTVIIAYADHNTGSEI